MNARPAPRSCPVVRAIVVLAAGSLALGLGGCEKLIPPRGADGTAGTGALSRALNAFRPGAAAKSQWREFRNQRDQVIRARVVNLVKDQLTIEREDGQQFTSPIALFSEADQIHAKRLKLDRLIEASMSRMQIPSGALKHTSKRFVVESKLGVAEQERDFLKSMIATHGSNVGCRTVVIGQETRDQYAAVLEEIEDLRFVLTFGPMLDATLK